MKSLTYLPNSPTVLKLHLDVIRQDTITKTIADAVDKFPGIDVFINNAGYSLMGDMDGIAEADARHQLETNFWVGMSLVKHSESSGKSIPPGRGGAIVQVSSMEG